MTTLASAGFDDALTIFSSHPGAKTRCSFLLAVGAA
jgi:hypothetical protein